MKIILFVVLARLFDVFTTWKFVDKNSEVNVLVSFLEIEWNTFILFLILMIPILMYLLVIINKKRLVLNEAVIKEIQSKPNIDVIDIFSKIDSTKTEAVVKFE